MPKQKLEIECPVCDAKMSIDARSCPKCGADLGMADFQDLENLANDISGSTAIAEAPIKREEPVEIEAEPAISEEEVSSNKEHIEPETTDSNIKVEPSSEEKPKEEKKEDDAPVESGKKKGLFSKFFGKKK